MAISDNNKEIPNHAPVAPSEETANRSRYSVNLPVPDISWITDPAQLHNLSAAEIEHYRSNPVMFQNYLEQLASVDRSTQATPPLGGWGNSRYNNPANRQMFIRPTPSFNRAFAPGIRHKPIVARPFIEAVCSAEYFFSEYLTKVHAAFNSAQMNNNVAMSVAIIVIRKLREMVVKHNREYYSNITSDDPFFRKVMVPVLVPILKDSSSEFMLKEKALGPAHSATLPEYLQRLSYNHPEIEIDQFWYIFPMHGISVTISASGDTTHNLVLPSPEDMLEMVELFPEASFEALALY